MVERLIKKFTKKEEELVSILIQLGYRRTVANVLVYIANTGDVNSRDIERGTELRQPEVSLAIKDMTEWGWVKEQKQQNDGPGRKVRFFRLAKPFVEIVMDIESTRIRESQHLLTLIRAVRDHVSGRIPPPNWVAHPVAPNVPERN
jgi:predicted transcriptional regulator